MDYFTTSTFNNTDATGRTNYYGIASVPTAKFDGRRTVGGGTSTTFSNYLSAYAYEQFYPDTTCLLSIYVDYDSTSRELWVKARVTAVDSFENARIRYAIAENNIAYTWGGSGGGPTIDINNHVVRKMLPNYNGVSFNINPGESFVDSQTYTLPLPSGYPLSCCNDKNTEVVVFVQRDDSNKPVLKSVKSGLFPTWVYGDATGDSIVNVADVIYLLNYLFSGGDSPSPLASVDVNYDCIVNIGDAVYLVNYVFGGGPEPLKGCAF